MPLNLPPRAADWTPHSTRKSHDNPWKRWVFKPLRCNQPLVVSPVCLGERVDNQPHITAVCHWREGCAGAPGAASQCLQPCWGRPRRRARRNLVVFATSKGRPAQPRSACNLQSNHVHACGRQVTPLPSNAGAMRAIMKAGHQQCTSCNSDALMICMLSDMIPMLVVKDDVTLKQQHQRPLPNPEWPPSPSDSHSLPLARVAVGMAT